jgi:hypothetical protein
MAKHTWQDHETNDDILSELKINPAVKKIQNYRNKWIQLCGEGTETDCHTYLWNINHVRNEAKENTSEDFSTTKESGTVREA